MWTEPSWNGCRKEGFTTTQTVITYASKKDTYVIIIGIYSLIKHCMQARGFGDCHTRILCMVPLYQCTVKACKKKHRCCWCISQASYRHNYSYYYDHIPLLCCSRWIFSDTCSQLIPPTKSSFSFLLESISGSRVWTPTVLANNLYCSGKQSILFWQTSYTVLANSLYCTGKQSILYLKWASDFYLCDSMCTGNSY